MKTRTHSLAARLLLQIFVVCLIALVAAMYITFRTVEFQEKKEIEERGDIIMQSLQTIINIQGVEGNLPRFINAMGAEPDIKSIVIVSEATGKPSIIASTENAWLGKDLEGAVPSDIRRDIKKVLASRNPDEHFHDNTEYEITLPIWIKSEIRSKTYKGVIHVVLDTTLIHKTVYHRMLQIGGLVCAALAIMGSLFFMILQLSVLRPIAGIRDTMEKLSGGDKSATAKIYSNDEIGMMADTFNGMIKSVTGAEIRLRAIIGTIMDSVISISSNGLIQSFSPAAELMFGYKAEEALGKNINMLMPEPYASHHDSFIQNYLTTGKGKIIGMGREVEGLRKDGRTFPAELTVNTTEIGGESIFVGVIRDITERKQTENRLSSYAADIEGKNIELEMARIEAQKATMVKSEFLANMSHEIRTPMNGIIGMTELLLETDLNDRQSRFAKTVVHSAEALMTIINDILDISKIEAGKLELETIPFSLRETAEESVSLLRIAAQEKNISLNIKYDPAIPDWFMGDPVRVRQIINNYLSNAVKFTAKGAVTLHMKGTATKAGRMQISISVQDTGIGIPKEVQAQLFQKFTQADTTTTRKYGGTGLGLSICAQLANLMGGSVGFESEAGKGSTFWATMDLSIAQAPANQLPERRQKSGDGQTTFAGIRVLLGEDNPINQEYATEILSSLGCEVTIVSNGRHAIEAVKSKPFDIVFMDCEMPEVSGLEASAAIAALKREGKIHDIPVLALTAHAMKGDRDRSLAAGMCDHLTKPVRKQQLEDALRRWLPEKGNAAQLSGKRVLLVEDTETNRELAENLLEEFGCVVISAGNGQEALDVLEAGKEFDLILMDCAMPVMDGYEATKRICALKKSGSLPPVPIVALTAHAMKGDREKCLEAGMDDYMTKPVRKESLRQMILRWTSGAPIKENASQSGARQPATTAPSVLDMEIVAEARDALGERYPHSLRRFLDEGEKRIERMTQEIENNGNWETIAFEAHAFKSSSACLGAALFPAHAAALEMAARKIKNGGNATSLAPLLTDLKESFETLSEAMENEIRQDAAA